MDKINIAIADDVKMTRLGLTFLLNENKDFNVVGEAENGRFLLSSSFLKDTHIILMDINMPLLNGIEATKEISSLHPHIKVIALTNDDGESYIEAMTKAGAKGFLMKSVDSSELQRAIKIVSNGGTYIAPELIILYNKANIESFEDRLFFSTIEKNILTFLCKGYTAKEIAKKLGEDITVIDSHCQDLLKKTKTRNAVGLVIFAIKHKITEI